MSGKVHKHMLCNIQGIIQANFIGSFGMLLHWEPHELSNCKSNSLAFYFISCSPSNFQDKPLINIFAIKCGLIPKRWIYSNVCTPFPIYRCQPWVHCILDISSILDLLLICKTYFWQFEHVLFNSYKLNVYYI